MQSITRLATLVLAVALLIGGVRADDLDAAIADLDSEDPGRREKATAVLADSESVALDELIDAMRRDGLSPEARRRLRLAAEIRFLSEPSPGLGVQFDAQLREPDGVGIARVIPEFPAATVLRAGDVVMSMEGQQLWDATHMRVLILSHRPGESMRAQVRRMRPDGSLATIEVRVPLGRYEDLENAAQPLISERRRAFVERLRRHGVLDQPGAEIGGAITPRAWLETEGLWPDVPPGGELDLGLATPRRSGMGYDPGRQVAVAGQPRTGLESNAIRRSGDLWRERSYTELLRRATRETDLDAFIAALRQSVRQLAETGAQITALADNPARPPHATATLQRLRTDRVETAARIATFKAQIEMEQGAGGAIDREADPGTDVEP